MGFNSRYNNSDIFESFCLKLVNIIQIEIPVGRGLVYFEF